MADQPLSYAYLGPEATFTESAMLQVARSGVDAPVAHTDVVSALDAVRLGAVDRAVVPIENSIEGGVTATLDSLGVGDPLVIIGEVIVPVTFVLAARPDTDLAEVRSIGSHPHALAQCRRRLATDYPGVAHVNVSSTGAAAAQLSPDSEARVDYEAALCAPLAAERYRLNVLATALEDNVGGFTRFAVISRPGKVSAATGADRTSLVVHLPHDQAGALLEMLEQFAVRGVNLSRIESRPSGDAAGRYAFSIDAEAHVTEERMVEVLVGLHRVCPRVRFLGSYPRADHVTPVVKVGTSTEDFSAARAWVDGLIAGTTT